MWVTVALLIAAQLPLPASAQHLANVAQNKPTLADSDGRYTYWHGADANGGVFRAEYAVDGLVDNGHRWASANQGPQHWLMVDLQQTYTLQGVVLYAGFDGDDDGCNGRDCVAGSGSEPTDGVCGFTLSVFTGSEAGATLAGLAAADAEDWQVAVQDDDTITRGDIEEFPPVEARFVRFDFDQSRCSTDNSARVFELEILAAEEETAGDGCSATGLTTLMAGVKGACCSDDDCNGVPDICDGACGASFFSFWDRCSPTLGLHAADTADPLTAFYHQCQASAETTAATAASAQGCVALLASERDMLQRSCPSLLNAHAAPTDCSDQCADTFLPIWDACSALAGAAQSVLGVSADDMQVLADLCIATQRPATVKHGGRGGGH
jgi:hypothetical protein